jgi:hypothetical protein
MRLLRWAGLTFAAGFILVLLVSTVGKTVLENYAQSEARAFAVSAGDDTSLPVPERARRVAAAVYKFYSQRDLSSPSLLFRLQPYLTNQVLPGIFRVQSGAIETILIEGACDSASRASVFILRQLGIDATQVNLITPHNGHSIVGVNLDDGSQILLDPTYGLAPLRHGSLLTTAETLALHRMQVPASTIWATIADGATYHPIYDDFASAALASQGEPLHWTVHLDLGHSDGLRLGEPDGDPQDVSEDGAAAGLSPYLHYLGHRFDRGWIRGIRAAQDVTVTFHTVGEPVDGTLTADRAPVERTDRYVRYVLNAGDELLLHDGRAERNWRTLRSYTNVDWVEFERR